MLQDFQRKNDGMNKKERKDEIKSLRDALVARQQDIREAKLPVIVLLEGWDSAGKGYLIGPQEILRRSSRERQIPVYGHRLDGGLRGQISPPGDHPGGI